jgi:5-methylthioadenosine/S-adenosylhomocysteine deaminase
VTSVVRDTIVRGRAVLRGVAEDGRQEIIENGAVLVRQGTVLAVDRFEALRAVYPNAALLGSVKDVVAPGFVNAHHHVGLTPFQLGAPDLPLELWLAAKIGLRSVDPYLDTLYSAFELIASGVTTVQHLHVSRTSLETVKVQAEAILRAYEDVGMRVSYSYGFRDQNRIVYEPDETFLARLPNSLAGELRLWLEQQSIPLAEHLAQFEMMKTSYHGSANGRIAVQLAPSNLHWCSDDALRAIGKTSARLGVPMHLHLLETQYQKAYSQRRFGKSAVRHLGNLGLLGPLTTLGHMVWADEDDLDLVAETGTCICHNASSNLRLRSGLAPCMNFLKRGITTAIGIDEAGLNDDRDMLQELRLVRNLHRPAGLDERDVPSAADVFRMGTESGARTTPFRGVVGRLDPGMAADLVLFDWAAIAGPYLDRSVPLVDAILQRASRNAVRVVMIAGTVVYKEGLFMFVDRDAVLGDIAAALSRQPSEDERRRQNLSEGLRPFVRALYDQAPFAIA